MNFNPLSNGKVIGKDTDPRSYHKQEARRGERGYVMSRSSLMAFAACPQRWVNGGDGDEPDTDSTSWGELIDCLVLQPDAFFDRYAIQPEIYPCEPTSKDPRTEKPWSGNADWCRRWKRDKEALGLICITKAEHAEAIEAASIVGRDEFAPSFLIGDRQVAVTAEFKDEETGLIIPIKCLIDMVPAVLSECLGDLKTARNASNGVWPRVVFERGYDVQGALYLDAWNAATDEKRNEFRHFIQENFRPWQVGRRLLSAEFIDIGRQRYKAALRRYARCLADKFWPGYDDQSGQIVKGWSLTEPDVWMVARTGGSNEMEAV